MSVEGSVVAGYTIGPIIGEGAFGEVRMCRRIKTGERFAVKIMDKNRTARFEKMVKQEVSIHRILSKLSGQIVKLVGEYSTNSKHYLFQELATGGDLFQKLQTTTKKVTEKRLGEILFDIASGINAMHKAGFVHRDLKPDNVMFKSRLAGSRVLVGDFGLSTRCNIRNTHGLSGISGTITYMAPEMLNGKGYGTQVDVWALGVTAFTLLSCRFPWDADNDQDIAREILSLTEKSLSQLDMRGMSSTARHFIKGCLKVDPAKRMTASTALGHPFLRGGRIRDSLERAEAIATKRANAIISKALKVPVDAVVIKEHPIYAGAVAPCVVKELQVAAPPGQTEINNLVAHWQRAAMGVQQECEKRLESVVKEGCWKEQIMSGHAESKKKQGSAVAEGSNVVEEAESRKLQAKKEQEFADDWEAAFNME